MPFSYWRPGFALAETGTSSQVNSDEKNPFVSEETEDVEEHPLVRHRSNHVAPVDTESADSGQVSYSASSPSQHDIIDRHPQHNGDAFERDEVYKLWKIIIILFMNELN